MPEESDECHQTLSLRVGSGDETKQDLKRYHKLQFHLNVLYLIVFMETVQQQSTYTNCTMYTKITLRFGNKATCLVCAFPRRTVSMEDPQNDVQTELQSTVLLKMVQKHAHILCGFVLASTQLCKINKKYFNRS